MRARLSSIWTIARRDLTTRARSKAFRVSSAIVLVALVLGIVIPAVAFDRATSYTVALVPGPGAPTAAAVTARAEEAGLTATVREVADRGAAVDLVEAGTAEAAVGPGEVVWKTTVDTKLAPVLSAALAQAAVAQRAQALGLGPDDLASLFAAARPTEATLEPDVDRGPNTAIAAIGMILLFVALNSTAATSWPGSWRRSPAASSRSCSPGYGRPTSWRARCSASGCSA